MNEKDEVNMRLYKDYIPNDDVSLFVHNSFWKETMVNNELHFISDGKTKWQHLLVKLPEKVRRDQEYFINFKVKIKTELPQISIKLQDKNGSFQELCKIKNEYIDVVHEESFCFVSQGNFEYLRVSSDEFIGENFFCIFDLMIKELSIKHSNNSEVKKIVFDLAEYSEASSGHGGILDFFHDIGIDTISVFYLDDTLMSAMHAMTWESGIYIRSDICLNKIECTIVTQTFTSHTPDELIISGNYDKDIPIVLCGKIDWYTRKKLEKISNHIYDFDRLYNYAVVKNCVIAPVDEYLKTNQIQAKLVHMKLVRVYDIKKPTENEKKLQNHDNNINESIIFDFDPDYKSKSIKSRGPFWKGTGKRLDYIEVNTEYCFAMNGIRRTFYQNKNAEINIWFIGISVSSGSGHVIDEHTIESFLQKILNEKYPETYNVNNVVMPCGWHYANFVKIMEELPVKDNDIIILSDDYSNVFNYDEFLTEQIKNKAIMLDLNSYFQRPHNLGEIFIDTTHMNPRGYKRYAEAIYTELFEKQRLVNEFQIETHNDNTNISQELIQYTESLTPYRKAGKNGCIVMNCNPFTLGHRYLIEFASTMVDNLYIFVVEEDKSIFKFTDRFMLVELGTKDISNVYVIPSGKFIISAITFKAYFEKGEKQDIVVDTSNDLKIFGKYIAPALNISIRFAGEEPLDNITNQYNANMKLLLPQFGVEFFEIPRKEQDGQVISASRVRKLLQERDFESIAKLVPATTLNFLKDNFYTF